jgi:NADPH:quinone reductase-like Zn-dependent oxidoreductase
MLATLAVAIPEKRAGKLKFFASAAFAAGQAAAHAAFSGKKFSVASAKPRGGDLEKISALIESGKLRPVIERVFPLERIAEAHRISEAGRVRGKLVVNIGD